MNERFQRLGLLIGEDKLKSLSEKTVLVLGVGGVGGFVATSLARCGISNIILVDFDTIDITNINRQIIAYTSTIGRKKVEVLKEMILDINPNCKVTINDKFINEENYLELFEDKIDYFVDCCDTTSTKKLVIKYALENDIEIISSMGTGNRLDPSKLEITEIRKTSGDPLARIIRKEIKDMQTKRKLTVLCSRELPIRKSTVVASNSFVPASAGLLITSHIINKLIEDKK